jgi:hypothetical protein
MKKAGLGLIVGSGLLLIALAFFGQAGNVLAQRVGPEFSPGANGDLTVLPAASVDKGQLVTVVDQRQRVMCVYRIDTGTGKIALKSVRNLNWDLQVTYYNNEPPLPQEIKTMSQQ